jgi:ribosomal protein L16 Arg81 hydroxylase
MFENAASVEIVHAPSVEEFAERYVRHERPVVVRGAIDDWPPTHKWTLDYLKSTYGERRVKIFPVKIAQERLEPGADLEVTFAKAIDDTFTPTDPDIKCRIHQESLDSWGPLHEESPPIRYVLRKILTKNIWMGSTGNVTGMHYDTEDNINVQVLGRKEIILFPSAQLYELYPRSVWNFMSNFSRVDIAAPDLSHYPRFSRATPLRAVLEPGDFIFIPIYWWHYFHTLEASLNVNFWWRATAGQALRRHGLRFWPRMAREGYLHHHILQIVSMAGESIFARRA